MEVSLSQGPLLSHSGEEQRYEGFSFPYQGNKFLRDKNLLLAMGDAIPKTINSDSICNIHHSSNLRHKFLENIYGKVIVVLLNKISSYNKSRDQTIFNDYLILIAV